MLIVSRNWKVLSYLSRLSFGGGRIAEADKETTSRHGRRKSFRLIIHFLTQLFLFVRASQRAKRPFRRQRHFVSERVISTLAHERRPRLSGDARRPSCRGQRCRLLIIRDIGRGRAESPGASEGKHGSVGARSRAPVGRGRRDASPGQNRSRLGNVGARAIVGIGSAGDWHFTG